MESVLLFFSIYFKCLMASLSRYILLQSNKLGQCCMVRNHETSICDLESSGSLITHFLATNINNTFAVTSEFLTILIIALCLEQS